MIMSIDTILVPTYMSAMGIITEAVDQNIYTACTDMAYYTKIFKVLAHISFL
jgi:hypothetical protein